MNPTELALTKSQLGLKRCLTSLALVLTGCMFSQDLSRSSLPAPTTPPPSSAKTVQTKFAVVSDSHNENDNLKKALELAKQAGAEYVVGLGDYTQVGTISELQAAKDTFDQANVLYFPLPGDHDLWQSRDEGKDPTSHYLEVFKLAIEPSLTTYFDFGFKGVRQIMVDNSDIYNGLSQNQWTWLETALNQDEGQSGTQENSLPTFLFLHQPLDHAYLDHLMGGFSEKVDQQRLRLLDLVARSEVDEVIAGNLHLFSQFTQPATGVKMTTVGATAAERNPEQPSFVMITVFTDGTYLIQKLKIG